MVFLGSGTIRVWELDLPNRKIWPTECQTGQMKRIVLSVAVSVASSRSLGNCHYKFLPAALTEGVCAPWAAGRRTKVDTGDGDEEAQVRGHLGSGVPSAVGRSCLDRALEPHFNWGLSCTRTPKAASPGGKRDS